MVSPWGEAFSLTGAYNLEIIGDIQDSGILILAQDKNKITGHFYIERGYSRFYGDIYSGACTRNTIDFSYRIAVSAIDPYVFQFSGNHNMETLSGTVLRIHNTDSTAGYWYAVKK